MKKPLTNPGNDYQTQPSHTPTPWETEFRNAGEIGANTEVRIYGPDRKEAGAIARICRLGIGGAFEHRRSLDETKANAAFIVKCVNAHEAMKVALEAVKRGTEPYDGYIMTMVNQALAKAGGK